MFWFNRRRIRNSKKNNNNSGVIFYKNWSKTASLNSLSLSLIWNRSWYHPILSANVLLIGLTHQIWKELDSKNEHIRLRLIPHALRIDKFCITLLGDWLWPLSCNTTWRNNKFYSQQIWKPFNSIWKAKHNRHSVFFQCDGLETAKQSLPKLWMFYLYQNFIFMSSLIDMVDSCLANINLLVPKWFASYPANSISRNKYTW